MRARYVRRADRGLDLAYARRTPPLAALLGAVALALAGRGAVRPRAGHDTALDAGGDVQEITKWINEARAERLQAEAVLRGATAPAYMSRDEIKTMVKRCASVAAVTRHADPADKREIYRALNLVLTYQPGG